MFLQFLYYFQSIFNDFIAKNQSIYIYFSYKIKIRLFTFQWIASIDIMNTVFKIQIHFSKFSKFNFAGWFKKPISGFVLTSETRLIFQNFHHLKTQYPDGNILLVTSFVCENWCSHILKSIWEIILKISWKSSYINNWQKHHINKL